MKTTTKKTPRSTTVKKKLPVATDKEISALASSIIAEREEARIKEDTLLEEPEIIPTPKHSFEEEPRAMEQPQQVRPKTITEGKTPLTPIVIKKHDREIFTYLSDQFGRDDGSFFILNELCQWRTRSDGRKKIKTVLIEDANGYRYQMFFDVTATSFLHG